MSFTSFQPALENLLNEQGWFVVHRERCTNDLWFLEIWTVESQWSPQGLQIYIVFEYDDPFHWATVSEDKPLDHYSTPWKGCLYLKRGWERDIPEFLSVLQAIRDRRTRP